MANSSGTTLFVAYNFLRTQRGVTRRLEVSAYSTSDLQSGDDFKVYDQNQKFRTKACDRPALANNRRRLYEAR